MAFKRYIHRHGKRLGPYYYENVRSHDGKVKSVYLGANPQNHPKHRIRKPLFFLIIVLMLILILGSTLFFLQNKSYLIKKAGLQEADFEIDQILLKVLIKSDEFIEKQIRIMNTGDKPAAITIEAVGLEDIVKIDSSSFTIKPGQTKVVALNFSSFLAEQKIEQQPGIYVGKLVVKSEKASKEIPMVVEIETKNVLFDMNLNPVAIERRVSQGSDTTIEVRLFNLQSIESSSVDVDYFVKDTNGNTILTESETVVVTTQASFFKTISIPKNLKPGPYIFAAKARFGDSVGTASYLFDVIGPEAETSFIQFCKNSILCMGLSLATILLLFALTAYFYFFIGAYLYERVTGLVTLPRKRKEKAEAEKPGIFDRIKARVSGWRKKRAETKAEKERLEREEELRNIAEERKTLKEKIAKPSYRLKKFYRVLDNAKKAIEDNDISKINKFYAEERDLYVALSNNEKREIYDKLMELYRLRNQFMESGKLQEEQREQEELKKQKELERQKAAEERKKNVKEFFHKIGLYKTQKEKEQIVLQKEQERQEKSKRKEELKKQKELEKQRAEEEKIKQEEERKREQEEEKKQKELEKQRQEQIKAQKSELIKGLEAKVDKNRETASQLNSELKNLESEKEALSGKINAPDPRLKDIDDKVLEKTRQIDELSLQKNSLTEKYKKHVEELKNKLELEETAKQSKIKEMKEELVAKQDALMAELEKELRKLSPSKRKSVEKWKRLELRAKLKLEEQGIADKLKEDESKEAEKEREVQEIYKKGLNEASRKQSQIKREIADLQNQKQQVLLEIENSKKELPQKERETQRLRQKIDALAQERGQLESELSKAKSGMPKFKLNFLSKLIPGKKAEEESEAQKIIHEAEKEIEEEPVKEEEQEEKLGKAEKKKRKLEELKKQKEIQRQKAAEEKKQKELEKQRAEEERIKQEEERKREQEEELSIQAELEKPEEKKPGLFGRLFGRKQEAEPEEEKRAGIFKTLFGKREKKDEAIEEKPAEAEQKPESEAEELEEAIKSLGLFKEKEKEISGRKEEIPKKKPGIIGRLLKKEKSAVKKPADEKFKEIEKKAAGRSRKLNKFYNALDDANDAINRNDVSKAKKMYAEARELYVGLEYQEKKEVYGRLMELYNKLSR